MKHEQLVLIYSSLRGNDRLLYLEKFVSKKPITFLKVAKYYQEEGFNPEKESIQFIENPSVIEI